MARQRPTSMEAALSYQNGPLLLIWLPRKIPDIERDGIQGPHLRNRGKAIQELETSRAILRQRHQVSVETQRSSLSNSTSDS